MAFLHSSRRFFSALFFLTLLAIGSVSFAEVTGYIAAEGRYFLNDPLYENQSEHSVSVSGFLETYYDTDKGDQRFVLTAFARLDSEDDDRSHADLRELYWWKNFGSFEVYAGLRKIFWGVTESVHLVDIVNQNDGVENIDGEDKLGQPMLQFVVSKNWGTLEAFLLPYFREREFVGEKSRLRPEFRILEDAEYQSDDENNHLDAAFRWSHYAGIWDFGLSHFSGTSRTPLLLPEFSGEGFIGLRPHYQQIHQTGMDIQATVDAWLLKAEIISVEEQSYGRNTAFAGGVEYTLFTLANSNADLGLIAEYQFDDRRGLRESLAQNDIALGGRLAMNDVDSSELLAIVSKDLDTDSQFISVEGARRFGDDWKIELEGRWFLNADDTGFEYQLRDDDHIQLEIQRYF